MKSVMRNECLIINIIPDAQKWEEAGSLLRWAWVQPHSSAEWPVSKAGSHFILLQGPGIDQKERQAA